MGGDAREQVWWQPGVKHPHGGLGQRSLEDPALRASWAKWFSLAPASPEGAHALGHACHLTQAGGKGADGGLTLATPPRAIRRTKLSADPWGRGQSRTPSADQGPRAALSRTMCARWL